MEYPKIPTIKILATDFKQFQNTHFDYKIELVYSNSDKIDDILYKFFEDDFTSALYGRVSELALFIATDQDISKAESQQYRKYLLNYVYSLLCRMYLIEEEPVLIKKLNIDEKLLKKKIKVFEDWQCTLTKIRSTGTKGRELYFDNLVPLLNKRKMRRKDQIDLIFDLFYLLKYDDYKNGKTESRLDRIGKMIDASNKRLKANK